MSEDVHELLGAYVLGGLTADERHAFDSHLPGCGRCRSELAAAAPIPALLGQLSIPAFRQPSPGMLGTLLKAVAARERRRARTRWYAGIAAACALVVGLSVSLGVVRGTTLPTRGRTLPVVSMNGEAVTGRATLTGKPWGTAVEIELSGLPAAGPFTLQVSDGHGHADPAATWAPTGNGRAIVQGASPLVTANVATLTVTGPDGAPLAVAEAS